MATTASVYNFSRSTRQILKRHRRESPSFVLHLHQNHFRFEGQNGIFMFDSPMKGLLQCIRDQKVPADLVDVLNEAGVQYFEGCLIVEVHDHRILLGSSSSSLSFSNGPNARLTSQQARGSDASLSNNRAGHTDPEGVPEIYRIVLHPTAETAWADLRLLDEQMGGVWNDQDVLEAESKILSLTAPPLCLTPDPHASRIANLMRSATAPPSAYLPSPSSPLPFYRNASRKRGINSIEVEKEEKNRLRREKIMRMMEHGYTSSSTEVASTSAAPTFVSAQSAPGTFVPSFSRMSFIEQWRARQGNADNAGPSGTNGQGRPQSAASGSAQPLAGSDGKANGDDTAAAKKPAKKKSKKQREREEAEAAAAAAEQERKRQEAEGGGEEDTPAKGKKKKQAQAQATGEAAAEPAAGQAKGKKKKAKEAAAAAQNGARGSPPAVDAPTPAANADGADTPAPGATAGKKPAKKPPGAGKKPAGAGKTMKGKNGTAGRPEPPAKKTKANNAGNANGNTNANQQQLQQASMSHSPSPAFGLPHGQAGFSAPGSSPLAQPPMQNSTAMLPGAMGGFGGGIALPGQQSQAMGMGPGMGAAQNPMGLMLPGMQQHSMGFPQQGTPQGQGSSGGLDLPVGVGLGGLQIPGAGQAGTGWGGPR